MSAPIAVCSLLIYLKALMLNAPSLRGDGEQRGRRDVWLCEADLLPRIHEHEHVVCANAEHDEEQEDPALTAFYSSFRELVDGAVCPRGPRLRESAKDAH